MSTFHEEAAMAHGAGNPMWMVTYGESFSGNEVAVEVRAAEYQGYPDLAVFCHNEIRF